ncbi:translation protein SH3-like domain-containing protein [Astrocystis sublimbata]|nr:translation protein SH3-like domain-containing protein [Astrocystis sublimbata]
MLTHPTRRPLGAWKGVLRRARQQQRPVPFARTITTETTASTPTAPEPPVIPAATPIPSPPPPRKPYMHSLRTRTANTPTRSAFAVYPCAPSSRARAPAVLETYHALQIRRLDPKGLRTQLFSRSNRDAAKVGDVLLVTTKRGEPFAGACLSIRRAGVDTAILLRNHLTKLGVEMWYKIYSPNVLGIEIVRRRPKRARRARLTYMRQPKHDMGNVDQIVASWRRTRNVFSSKGRGGKTASAAGAKGGKK